MRQGVGAHFESEGVAVHDALDGRERQPGCLMSSVERLLCCAGFGVAATVGEHEPPEVQWAPL